jgi:putative hydrolases of HD superfamily
MNISAITQFLLELDRLKSVNRRSYINRGERLENSAEHSWHLAMACWLFAGLVKHEINVEKLSKMALLHDLGEIDVGDTFLYDQQRGEAGIKEREGILRLANIPGNSLEGFVDLWDEQEMGDSSEAKLLKVVDRLLPLLLNIASNGLAWRENGIRKSQVLNAHAFIKEQIPEIHSWIVEQVNHAVTHGWLIDE